MDIDLAIHIISDTIRISIRVGINLRLDMLAGEDVLLQGGEEEMVSVGERRVER